LRSHTHGGSGIFNDVNIGLLIGHVVYGTSPDWTISGSGPLQSYFPIWSGGSGYDWVRLSEFGFDGPNLRWMSILSCNNLPDSVYQDSYNKEVLPVGDGLHLLCGAKTSVYIVQGFGIRYANALIGRNTTRRTIPQAWFYAGQATQSINPNVPVIFRVIGWPNCFGDDVINYQSPNSSNPANIDFLDLQVTSW
jgi:hypothetical protein